MRTKSRSWFIPLLILFAIFWVAGKKDTRPALVQPTASGTASTLVSTTQAPPIPTPPALPDVQYVSADKLNVREQPGGRVISKLQRGDRVQIYQKTNDWVRISIDGQPTKWLSSQNLCSGSKCYVVSTPKPVRPVLQPVGRPANEYGSSCPCSSGNVCIGPRGGRYCITSGGNKRYGV